MKAHKTDPRPANRSKASSKKNVEAIYPLSPLQQGMLFHSMRDPGSGVYVVQLECTFEGLVDHAAFEQAWQEVIYRHPSLRTGFFWQRSAEPVQIVSRRVSFLLAVHDWRQLPPEDQFARWQVFVQEDRHLGFNLTKAPLMRCTLAQLAGERHRFLWSFHHILLDGWSLPLVLREVFAFYEAFSAGHTLEMPSPRPYRDFIAWLQRQEPKKAENYWREQLAGFRSPTALPVDRLATEEPQGYLTETLELPSGSTAELQALAQNHQLTLNTIVQSAWAMLLSRIAGASDILFGVTLAGRPTELAGVEGIVGLFINTLPLRVRLDPRVRLIDLLKELQDRNVNLRQYEHVPLVELQSWSEVPRSESLFDSILVFENYPLDEGLTEQGFSDLTISDIHAHEQTNYPLTVVVVPGTSLALQIIYDRQEFSPSTIRCLLGHLRTLLEGMAAKPQARVSELPLLTAAERQQLLVDWNATQTDFPQDQCIHQLFEAQVENTPAATAVVFEDQTLTYAELNVRANQLAHYLRTVGVGPDTLVGLCVERSPEMIIGLLGILKAGGAYVPLDPAYPKDRLAFMLENSQAPVLVIHSVTAERLPASHARMVCVDQDWSTIAQQSENDPTNRIFPEHRAYVIHTSGSTGKPKGIQISHRALLNFLCSMARQPGIDADDVVLAVTTLSFDISTLEIFLPLIVGARTVIVSREVAQDGNRLSKLLVDSKASLMQATPATWQMLINAGWQSTGSLRVLCGGEALSPELAAQLRERATVLWNMYGPTETTVWSSVSEVDAEGGVVPIGRPVANTQLYILDTELNPVPVGVAGELYIGGVQLARGYLNRPALTAEKFIPNPFSQTLGARLYRTGDLARYRPDGNIEFLGRIDHQVKVRGFRIELGEIEATLSQHPQVREAVVVAREDSPGDKRLVAYVVGISKEWPEIHALRSFLKDKLPDYMVPAAFVFLDSLPLSPNGKVDRKALPAPEAEGQLALDYVAPRTPTEEILAAIWAEVLGVERVGIRDNFFELGGHSLLVTQVVSRIRAAFEVELPLRVLFEAPAVAELAHAVDAVRQAEAGLQAPPIEPISRDAAPPLSFAQQRLWFLDQLKPNDPFYNMPGVVRLQGALDAGEALARSLNALIERHEALRTTFATVDGAAVQVIAPELKLTLAVIDLTELPEEAREAQARQLAAEEAQQSFDLAEGPLVRACLLRLAEEDHLLQVTLHHIVADGWSLGIFVNELAALYRAFEAGQPSPLPLLPVQYADFAHWQRQWLQGEVLDQQLGYWREQLEGLPALLELPTDRPRPPVQSFHGAHYPITVSSELTQMLRRLSRGAGVTLFMTLLAAFQVLLARYTGQRDFAVGTPIANRNRAETEGLIGFFVNTLVLRADLADNPRLSDLLARTKEITLGAYAHQDVPFERLVDALQPERDMSHSPLFQVMFALQNAPLQPADLPGLKLTPWTLESGTAKFDLTLELAEEGEGLVGNLEYNTDLFDQTTIERLSGHLLILLEGITQVPQARVSELPLLTAAERQQLLVDWNATQTDFPQDQCIHQLFEAQVENTPAATAVVFEDQTLTYAELNVRANQLAHYLRTVGVGPDTLVGLCVERSPEMIIGLLGILKAGGAYVPLDPAYPKDRLAFMLENSQAPVLVIHSVTAERLPASHARMVCVDQDWSTIAQQSENDPTNRIFPEHRAYVIHTSGSTGKPKGIQISHRALLNFLCSMARQPGIDADDVVLAVTTLSFDISTLEIFLPLIVGARTVIVSREVAQDGNRLSKLLVDSKASLMQATPATWQMLINAGWQSTGSLRVLCGGEALSPELAAQLRERATVLWNMYGPTETTVWSSVSEVDAEGGVVPIGRPVANTQLYILDTELNPVPVGVAGELYIGGVQLARGYLNRPALTAEKFIPNPFSQTLGARLYRTGDLARYRPDGNIEFLGRIDHQVKVRGFRIELGEIEATLSQHPQVREAVVVAREDSPGDKRLVAYVVGISKEWPEIHALRSFLKDKLPDYMVPAAFVFLDSLPLSPNGKVDRKALPAPEAEGQLALDYVAPRTPAEALLAEIWAELLRIERVGIHDNFFELGGHSLLVVQLTSLLEKGFDKAGFPVATVFNNPTIAQLASVLSGEHEPVYSSALVALGREGRSQPIFCVPGADGMVLSLQRLAHHLGPDQPFYGLEALGLDGRSAPIIQVEDMARYYLDAMKTVQPNGPYLLGGYSFGGWVAFEMALQLHKQGDEVQQLFLIDTKAPQSDNASRVDWDDLRLIKTMAGLLERHWKIDLKLPHAELASLTSNEQIDRLHLALHEADVLPAKFGRRRLGGLMRVMKSNSRIPFAPRKKYPEGLTLIRACDIRPEDDQDATAPRVGDNDPTLGWGDYCEGPVQVHFVPGDHSTMVLEPHVQDLAKKLKALLLTGSAHRAA